MDVGLGISRLERNRSESGNWVVTREHQASHEECNGEFGLVQKLWHEKMFVYAGNPRRSIQQKCGKLGWFSQ